MSNSAEFLEFAKGYLFKDPEFFLGLLLGVPDVKARIATAYQQAASPPVPSSSSIAEFSDALELTPSATVAMDTDAPASVSSARPTSPYSSGSSVSSEAEESASASASSSSSSTEDDGFTTVQGGKRKKKLKASSHAPAAKKEALRVIPSPPPSAPAPVPATVAPTPTVASSAAVPPSVPTSGVPSGLTATSSSSASQKKNSPPPLYIQDKARWTDVSRWCVDLRINFTSARSTQTGIKVTVPTSNDYRALSKLLRERNVSFHTYTLPEERQTRVVIRRIPREIPAEEIKADLQSQNIPVDEVHRMYRSRTGDAYDMVLVICSHVDGYHPIFQVRSICNLSGIEIEKPHKSGIIGQCHRCQLYGHSQRNCHAKPRCVKCLGDHGTSDCTRPKDRALCTDLPSCVLCGESGHPANYRGCPKAPKSHSSKLAKRANARQQREYPPPQPHYNFNIPLNTRLSPQRPNAWFPAPQQQAFPALVSSQPTPTPTLTPATRDPRVSGLLPAPSQAPVPPPPAPKAAPAALANPPATAPVASGDDVVDPFSIIASTFLTFNTPRAWQMARELQVAQRARDLPQILKIYQAYPEITRALNSYSNN